MSLMTEWLGKQILDGFLRQFQTKAGDSGAQEQEGTVQRKTAKEMESDCIKITCTVDL